MSVEYGLSPSETHEQIEDRGEFKRIWGRFLAIVITLEAEDQEIWSYRQSLELARNGVKS